MWKKAKLLLIILSVALNVAFVSVWVTHALGPHLRFAGPCPQRRGHTPARCPLYQKLGASEKQRQQIEPRWLEFQESSRALCRQISRLRLEIIDLIAAPEVDHEAIRAKQEQILAGQRKMQELVIAQLLAEKQVLTPEQQKELFGLIRQRSGCPGHGPLRGPGPMNGRAGKGVGRRRRGPGPR